MASLVIVCMLCLHCVYGSDWLGNYMDGMKEQISVYGMQQFPEKAEGRVSYHQEFTCPDSSPSPLTPTTVDRVKPADVKIVAALGDSLTAAIGANATTILQLPTEYRQFSFSIGGYGTMSDVITLPNILKKFNPNLVGFAKRSTLSYRPAKLEDAGFNLAVTGANSLLPEQARHLIETLRSFPGINYEEDWKVITIFIGGNDLCDYCKNQTLFSAESFIYNVTKSLDMMQKEIPRAIVNMVQLLQIDKLRQVNNKTLGCVLQRVFCSCVVQPKEDSPELLAVMEQNLKFQEKLEHLIEKSGRYDGKKDFAVVLQPFVKNTEPSIDQNGEIDYSFFTPDCFHLTIKGHEQMAMALWNNMFQPTGNKSLLKRFSDDIQLLCPSKLKEYNHQMSVDGEAVTDLFNGHNCPQQDHPYIYTRKLGDNEASEEEKNTNDASNFLAESRILTATCLIILSALHSFSS